jgi:hypothetical protein
VAAEPSRVLGGTGTQRQTRCEESPTECEIHGGPTGNEVPMKLPAARLDPDLPLIRV